MYKNLLIFLFLSVTVFADRYHPRNDNKKFKLVDEEENNTSQLPKCNINNNADSCLDCRNLMVCFLSEVKKFVPMIINCKDENPKTPYCVNNRCTNSTVDPCQPKSHSCYGVGLLLDPENCHQYYNCSKIGAEPKVEICSKNWIFNPKNGLCKLPGQCHQYTPDNLCKDKEMKIVPFPDDKRIYARCPPKEARAIMRKCKGAYEFDIKQNKCDALCWLDDQRLPDNCDCHSYYQCFRDLQNNEFFKIRYKCPFGQYFDKSCKDIVGKDCKNIEDKENCIGIENGF